MRATVTLTARGDARRCAICHDDLLADASQCHCGATHHVTCRSELGRCPTIGCRRLLRRPRHLARFAVAALVSAVTGAVVAKARTDVATIAFFVHAFVLPLAWARLWQEHEDASWAVASEVLPWVVVLAGTSLPIVAALGSAGSALLPADAAFGVASALAFVLVPPLAAHVVARQP